MKHWTDERLRKLFDRYNRLYWRGALSGYRVVATTIEDDIPGYTNLGECLTGKRIIKIDTGKHQNDRKLRQHRLHSSWACIRTAFGTGAVRG
jgi:hypothetical protein